MLMSAFAMPSNRCFVSCSVVRVGLELAELALPIALAAVSDTPAAPEPDPEPWCACGGECEAAAAERALVACV